MAFATYPYRDSSYGGRRISEARRKRLVALIQTQSGVQAADCDFVARIDAAAT
ncbi:hypothetical protein PsSCT_23760 [Pseudomonas sp. SCT]